MAKSRHYEYDVFISHAVEDKMAIATALREALEAKGIKVWYSSDELSVGDRLIDTIYKGLEDCRFGVVILSPTYLGKIWALGEFFFFLTRDEKGSKVILPVLYDITPEELAMRYPLMADIVAVRASLGIEHVAQKLYDVIKKAVEETTQENKPANIFGTVFKKSLVKKIAIAVASLVLILVTLYVVSPFTKNRPSKQVIDNAIADRISYIQQNADADLQQLIDKHGGRTADPDSINRIYSDFMDTKSYYRNEYSLITGQTTIRAKRNVDKALEMDVSLMTPLNRFLFESPRIYQGQSVANNGLRSVEYLYYNISPVQYTIVTELEQSNNYYVTVEYSQPIRTVRTSLLFPASPRDTKRKQVTITGFRPVEIYVFNQSTGSWSIEAIQ